MSQGSEGFGRRLHSHPCQHRHKHDHVNSLVIVINTKN